jgi:hypothetical protein
VAFCLSDGVDTSFRYGSSTLSSANSGLNRSSFFCCAARLSASNFLRLAAVNLALAASPSEERSSGGVAVYLMAVLSSQALILVLAAL